MNGIKLKRIEKCMLHNISLMYLFRLQKWFETSYSCSSLTARHRWSDVKQLLGSVMFCNRLLTIVMVTQFTCKQHLYQYLMATVVIITAC